MPVGHPSLPGLPRYRSPQSTPQTAVSGESLSCAVTRLALPIVHREPPAPFALRDDHAICSECSAERLIAAAVRLVPKLTLQELWPPAQRLLLSLFPHRR